MFYSKDGLNRQKFTAPVLFRLVLQWSSIRRLPVIVHSRLLALIPWKPWNVPRIERSLFRAVAHLIFAKLPNCTAVIFAHNFRIEFSNAGNVIDRLFPIFIVEKERKIILRQILLQANDILQMKEETRKKCWLKFETVGRFNEKLRKECE